MMLNLFLDLRNINLNDEQTQNFICFIRVQLMALDIMIWAEVFLARYDTLDSYRFQSGNRYDFPVRC